MLGYHAAFHDVCEALSSSSAALEATVRLTGYVKTVAFKGFVDGAKRNSRVGTVAKARVAALDASFVAKRHTRP